MKQRIRELLATAGVVAAALAVAALAGVMPGRSATPAADEVTVCTGVIGPVMVDNETVGGNNYQACINPGG